MTARSLPLISLTTTWLAGCQCADVPVAEPKLESESSSSSSEGAVAVSMTRAIRLDLSRCKRGAEVMRNVRVTGRKQERWTVSRAIIAAAIVVIMPLSSSCGPEVDDGAPLEALVYTHPGAEFYRLDRRIEVVAVDPTRSRDGCGYLTDRAYDDIESTIDALDPAGDYDVRAGCGPTTDPKGRVYLEAFEHSPFACDWNCCHPDLMRLGLVYYAVENNLFDQEPVIDGEPYVAVEPDRPCE